MFISHVSHELRTPMAALIAELELARHKDRSQDDYKQVIENALKDAFKIEKLSMGLLDLAKASYNLDQIALSEVRIDEILIDAVTIIKKANPQYKIDLIFNDEYDDDELITITGNEYLLRIAFVNLIENSCKFSVDMTSVIKINISNEKILIEFLDNGIGIPPEDLPMLFKPFYRGQNKSFTSGNGIGLALVDKIIKLHSGTINVDSQIGQGSCFKINLPHIR